MSNESINFDSSKKHQAPQRYSHSIRQVAILQKNEIAAQRNRKHTMHISTSQSRIHTKMASTKFLKLKITSHRMSTNTIRYTHQIQKKRITQEKRNDSLTKRQAHQLKSTSQQQRYIIDKKWLKNNGIKLGEQLHQLKMAVAPEADSSTTMQSQAKAQQYIHNNDLI